MKSSGSNGIVERGVSEVEGEIRALFLALQDRLGRKIDARERIVAFIPEYAAYLMNRLMQGSDGKVAYERIKGKRPTVLGIEFGEKVLFKIKAGQKMEKINARWDYGIFVGVKRRSNELMIATSEGIIKVRSVRRLPVERRWSEDCVGWVKWAPWNEYKDAENADGEVPEGIPIEEKVNSSGSGERVVYIDTRDKAPREFYISKKNAEKYGYTRGCGGCTSWFRGLARQPHTEACRNRFKELMKDEAKVKNNEVRKRDFEEKEEQRKRRRKDKKEERAKRKAEGDAEELEEEEKEEYMDADAVSVDIDVVESRVDEWVREVQDVEI